MRVSTNLLFDTGALNIQRNQFSAFKIQNQISTGRRVLSPEDDPVAAAQALITEQSKALNNQYVENQGTAKSELGLLEGQLSSVGDLIHAVRERAIQLGGAALTPEDRNFIAEELRQRFEGLIGIANSQNGQGQYLFSGFQGATKPFSLESPTPAAPYSAANPYVSFAGDEGQRLLQVDSTRQMSINASGREVFMQIKQGNGTFTTSASSANTGSGVADQGSVTNIADWNASIIQPQNFKIVFKTDPAGVLKYNLTDATGANTLFAPTGAVGATGAEADWKVFTPGQAIQFTGLDTTAVAASGSLGIQVQVTGTPADGDSFAVGASKNQSLFDTLQNLIAAATALPNPASPGNTLLTNRLGESLAALDRALDNTLRVRATVGSQLLEIDALGNAASEKNLQYEKRLSELQDLDYADAISRLNKQQLQLEAAQRSFVQITGLSLFNFL